MTAVRDLIHQALRSIGVLAAGEVATASEAQDALDALNQLVAQMNNDSLLLYNVVEHVFALVAGTQSYTIGTGGVFNTARPLAIEQALLRDTAMSPPLDIAMGILTQEQWAGVSLKGLSLTYPLWVYLDLSYPLAHVIVWPIPDSGKQLVLWLQQPLTAFATLDDAVSLPNGYERLLRLSLAQELCLEYGRAIGPELAALVESARGNVKRANAKTPVLTCDTGTRQGRSKGFNIYVG
jgi:hypothetical protein